MTIKTISEAAFKRWLSTPDGEFWLRTLPRPFEPCPESFAGVKCRRRKGHGGLCTAQKAIAEGICTAQPDGER